MESDVNDIIPFHREILAELTTIRQHMGISLPSIAPEEDLDAQELSSVQAVLQSYRAQIEQCEKLKIELDLIHDAINRTKQEIAMLHGKSFSGEEMTKVTGELGAVVGGTEEATQHILEAAEAIDHAAGAFTKVDTPEQRKRLAEDVQENVVAIFEACNFQDLTGQRISKVVATLQFIEQRVANMMEIWGGGDGFPDVTAPAQPAREGDRALLNGPPRAGDVNVVSQNDIDVLFA